MAQDLEERKGVGTPQTCIDRHRNADNERLLLLLQLLWKDVLWTHHTSKQRPAAACGQSPHTFQNLDGLPHTRANTVS